MCWKCSITDQHVYDLVTEGEERLGDRQADPAVAAGHEHRARLCLLVVDHVGDASDYPWVATNAARSVVLEPEPDLQPYLEVLDLADLDLPAHLGHLEPVDVSQRRAGPANGVADGLVDPVR